MGISVGELFVNLGIKGADKSINDLKSVSDGVKGIGSVSLEAKAALLGVFYATGRLMSESGRLGTGFTNFTATIGTSAQTLQKYQYAARQIGVANEEVTGTFKSLQDAMVKTAIGKGAPEGLARVAKLTGNIGRFDVTRFAEHPEELINRLQDYAKKEKDIGLRNTTLRSFGINDSMIAALSRGAFTAPQLNKAPTYSDKEIASLDKANIAWSNLGNKIEMAFGHFNAKYGGVLVKDLSQMVDGLVKFSDILIKIGEDFKVFDKINAAIKDITEGLKILSNPKLGEGLTRDLKEFFGIADRKVDTDKNANVSGDQSFLNKKEPEKTSALQKTKNNIEDDSVYKRAREFALAQKRESALNKELNFKPGQAEKIAQASPNIFKAVGDDFFNNPITTPKVQKATAQLNNPATNKNLTVLKNPDVKVIIPPQANLPNVSKSVLPTVPHQTNNNSNTNSNTNVKIDQTFNLEHTGGDVHKTGEALKKYTKDAFFQGTNPGQVS